MDVRLKRISGLPLAVDECVAAVTVVVSAVGVAVVLR
jgi:hypothetical protein